MSRTVAPPPTDRRYWRRILALSHPDHGGDEDLFVWISAVRDYVFGNPVADDAPHYSDEAEDGTAFRQQHHGATFRSTAYAAHLAGFSDSERLRWYEVASSVPLSQRHMGHIIARLQESKAA
jgi:hypothetical protein